MKAKEILAVWDEWDSPDLFTVYEITATGKLVACHDMTGVEFEHSPLAERVMKRFGSQGKGTDGIWRHYVVIAANDIH